MTAQLPEDIINQILQFVSLSDLHTSVLLVSSQFYNCAKQTIQNRSNRYIFTGPFYHDEKCQFELFHKAQTTTNLMWNNGQRVQHFHSHYILHDSFYVYFISILVAGKKRGTLAVNCYTIENPDTLIWSVPFFLLDSADSIARVQTMIREFVQDDINVYIVVANNTTHRSQCYAIEKRTSKLTQFHTSETSSFVSVIVDTLMIITPSYILVERPKQKVIIFNKNFQVHREICWNETEATQTMAIYGVDNYNVFNINHDRVYLDVRPTGASSRLSLFCYSAETGDVLFRFQVKGFMALNVHLTYVSATHWCFSGNDGESKLAAVVDLETGNGFNLANPAIFYLAETFSDDKKPHIVGFCNVDARRGVFSYIPYDQQREPHPPQWIVPLEELKGFRYQPNVQIQVINNDSLLIALMYGSNGCFVFAFKMGGLLLWRSTIIVRTDETMFSHFDIHVRMKVIERDRRSRIIIQGTITEFGFFVREFDSNGTILLDISTPWSDFHKQVANLPEQHHVEPVIQQPSQPKKKFEFTKIKKLFK
jgi:hypothetical protein